MKQSIFIGSFIIMVIISTWMVMFWHSRASLRCSLDGSQIQPLYEVVIIHKDKSNRKFSCVVSAQIWFRGNSERVSSILVTDEVSGEKIKADHAFYVESEVVTTPHTRNKIHVFGQETAAKLHARKFKGKLVKNPFRVQEKKAHKMATYRHDPTGGSDFLFPSPQRSLCLPSIAALIKQQNCSCMSQRYNGRPSEGHSSPPYKPPKNIV